MSPDAVPDYYAEFDLDRSATADEIRRQLDRAFRTWSGRASRSPDARKRRAAEDKVELISEARKELLDSARRKAYDRRLDQARQRRARRPEPGTGPEPGMGHDSGPQPTQGGRDWVGHARRLMNQGNDEGALYELRQAVHHDDGNGDAWRLLGAIHAKRGQLADALQEFQRALDLHPDDSLTHMLIARVHEQGGNRLAAIDWRLKALRLAPDDIDFRIEVADSLCQFKRYDEALSHYEQALAERPDDMSVRNRIAWIWSLRAEGAMTWHPFKQQFVVASVNSASMVAHCVDQALAVGISDDRLGNRLTAYRIDADKALTKTWRWDNRMIAVLIVCVVLLYVLPGVLALLALAGLFGLPIAMGVKPRWRHTYNDLPPYTRPPKGGVS